MLKGFYQINNSLSFFPYYGEVSPCQIILFLTDLHHTHKYKQNTSENHQQTLRDGTQDKLFKKLQVIQMVLEVFTPWFINFQGSHFGP